MLIRENVPEARQLNPRIKIRWYLEKVAVLAPLLGGLYIIMYLLTYDDPGGIGTMDEVIFVLAAIACLAIAYIYVEVRFRKFVYALREKDFLIQKGVVERIRYVIPYEKIQNVTVSRDLLEQALGLGTLHIETAAHVIVENDILLPGVSNQENLVTELVTRSREAKAPGIATPETVASLLNDMLAELRGIRSELGRKAGGPGPDLPAGKGTEPISAELRGTKVLFERPSKKKRGG
jgi:membrane protein YdbS with pleckstrin-like domain